MAYGPSCLLFLNCFRAHQMGFEQVFDNVTVNRMDALREQFQSLVNYVLSRERRRRGRRNALMFEDGAVMHDFQTRLPNCVLQTMAFLLRLERWKGRIH